MAVRTEDNPAPLSELLKPYSPPLTTLVDHLIYWEQTKPDRIAFGFYADGETVSQEWTFSHLAIRSRAVAAELENRKLQGERILLLYPPCLEFIEAFFGCQMAGAIPVPAFPPRKSRNGGRIDLIAQDANAQLVLTNRETISRMELMLEETDCLKTIPMLASEEIPDGMQDDFRPAKISTSDIGLLQYTSGSTGSPKGVVLTHGNLIENCKMITHAFQIFQQGSGVSWLPTYHDMGLVGGILNPLFIGRSNHLMPPLSFLAKPSRWLKAITRQQATIAGGPNFAYQLCVDKVEPEELNDLDLSSWEVAFNGAEPIRPSTLKAFNEKFGPVGFHSRAHYPCYGMAETTLLVTGGSKHTEPVIRNFDKAKLDQYIAVPVEGDGRELVGCGSIQPDEQVIIVDQNTNERLPENRIGEIWVCGTCVGRGYWNKPDETEETFQASYQGSDEKFLRTGDLGFLSEGELFVTGRLKDLIIVRGVNRYPQDIETTVEQTSDRLQTSGTAAFSVDVDGAERLVIVSELERTREKDWSQVIDAIRRNVTAEHELPPDAVVMVRTGSIQKTSSGKIQRHACKQAFLDGTLKVIDQWIGWEAQEPDSDSADSDPPTTNAHSSGDSGDPGNLPVNQDVLNVVIANIRSVARDRAKNLSLDTNIVIDLGLDSLERLQIANNLEEHYRARFPDDVLQDIETVQEVVLAICQHLNPDQSQATAELPAPTAKRIDGEIPVEYYDFAQAPEVLRFERQKQMTDLLGVRNPFFSVHEGQIADTTTIEGRNLLSFASYNYLGLNGDPRVSEASKRAIDQFGTSVSASRLVSGEKTIHRELETELRDFFRLPEVLVVTGGHATNQSVVGHLVSRGDLILHDELAHNSIIQGAFLSGATRRPFPHNDWKALDRTLTEIRRDYRRVMIAIEGLYSMDGDFPELPEFIKVKKKHKCLLYMDEAHSFGTLGRTGRGVCELFGVDPVDVDFIMGTVSKALGSFGGFIASRPEVIDYLRYTIPGFVFAAGLPAADVAAALESVRILEKEPERVEKLANNSKLFLSLAREAGLDTGPSQDSPIVPVITGDSIKALRLSEALYLAGINAQPILHPAVEEDRARVRFFISAAHSEDQIRRAIQVVAESWEKINQG